MADSFTIDMLPDVVLFPKWNEHVTAAQRFSELAVIAEKYPERFEKVFVGWVGSKEGRSYNNDQSLNMTTTEVLGWLSSWSFDINARTRRSPND